MQLKEHVPLKDHTTFRLGGSALYYVDVTGKEDIVEVVSFAEKKDLPFFVLGGGSNTVFSDKGFQGVVLHMRTKGIVLEREDTTHVFVRVEAGEDWDTFVEYCIKQGWYGLENLSYIPGTVGATPVQNIGAYGVEVSRVIFEVTVYDIQKHEFVTMSATDCKFTYRTSIFKEEMNRYIIVSVLFRLEKVYTPIITYKDVVESLHGKEVTAEKMREIIIDIRKNKLPDWKILPTAGSFFKNPEVTKVEGERLQTLFSTMPLYPHNDGYKIPAGFLIEHVADMKGFRHKGVGVYEKHALVLVNLGDGTYQELMELVHEIQEKVKTKTGVNLVPEVNIID